MQSFFTPNEGTTDRIVRIVLGLALFIGGFIWLSGGWQIATYVAGAISIVTGITGFCGLYKLLGINTCPVKKD